MMLLVSSAGVLICHWAGYWIPLYGPINQLIVAKITGPTPYLDIIVGIGVLISITSFVLAYRLKISVSTLILLVSSMIFWAGYWWYAASKQLQFPIIEYSAFILLGWVFGLIEKYHEYPLQNIFESRREWGLLSAKYFKNENQLSKAWEILKQLGQHRDVLELSYQFAEHCERKREYELAKEVYQTLSKGKGFKDSHAKLERLSQIRQTNPGFTGTIALESTLMVPGGAIQPPTLGRYRIDSVLGKGAMGVVYRGIDPAINREVAIKTLALSEEFDDGEEQTARRRFFREAETAGKLNHPNIVTIYDVGEENELAFIAMDLLPGVPLDKHNKPNTLLAVPLVYQILVQISAGISYAHQKGVVHRDIKPANIIYDDEKHSVIITDFGIAHVTDQSKTRTGAILGSPFYMSPEQIQGKRVDGRSDIFSLGVTFYQLLTGELPFTGDSLATVALKITTKKHEQVRKIRADLPPSASRIINKALQKEPEKRYQSVDEFQEALENALRRDFNLSPFN
ncbi:serine/threonine protein kinase [Pleionea sediminis]|uniref:serine/threonine protein kinase n=1 Tax=Pleionea sediminis TaxID=2569479 RepID=UPI0013DE6E01|nr:serine/threonine-protein kinase [Pleionea sediminis]